MDGQFPVLFLSCSHCTREHSDAYAMASVQPAPLEQVLHQLVNNLAELTRILSGQESSEHAQNKQLVAQNSPETESDVEMSTQLPLEVETILCVTPVAGSDLTEAVVPVEGSTDATRGVHENTTASEPPLEIAPLQCGAPATNPDISTEAVPANVSTDTPPDTSKNTATPAPPQLDDSYPPEDVVTVTGAPSEVSRSPIVSELPQPDAIVRLPRDLDEWFVSPLPTGIRIKIFQAAGTSFLMSHPLFGFITLKLNLENEQYFEIAYTQYTYYVRTKFQLVELPALEGKDAHPSDSDYTHQQARQVGPGSLTAMLAASVLGGAGGSGIDLLFSIFRRINSVPLAKYSTLRQTRTTVNGKWRDIMSDERRSTVLERRSTVVTTLDEISTGSKYTTVILADDKPSGICHHLLIIFTIMGTWEQRWHEILDVIEVETSIQMHEIQDTHRLDELILPRILWKKERPTSEQITGTSSKQYSLLLKSYVTTN
ncbi:uncharacterized protein CLUP02_04604 [Colletotrichum lupini]|uniref:Uncharacterized protein n=1 Tax=Colletotrichum lupini TaxID=145971 RepID=A0A9Q8SL23_9PEZI|nr:uncharacterized protein CLUP02_04604 [Colletotrichum lupini]UQC79125.1 hypothetical protein CLUP02_04604 [Colletotrichum lupini]